MLKKAGTGVRDARLPDSVAHGKPVRAACLKVHKDTAAPNLSAHTRLFGLTYLEMREKVKSTLTAQRHVYTQRNKDIIKTC